MTHTSYLSPDKFAASANSPGNQPRQPGRIRVSTPAVTSGSAVSFVRWLVVCLLMCGLGSPWRAAAQQFRPVPALSFSTTFGLDNPLSQVITATSTGTAFAFSATATSTTGGTWLSITPNSYGCCGVNTPYAITVTAAPAVTLAAGTYTGEIVLKPALSSIATVTIPVTLVVHAPTATYFDQIVGGLTYSMLTAGGTPPGQELQVRNAGA
jgi:hypothetical protein